MAKIHGNVTRFCQIMWHLPKNGAERENSDGAVRENASNGYTVQKSSFRPDLFYTPTEWTGTLLHSYTNRGAVPPDIPRSDSNNSINTEVV